MQKGLCQRYAGGRAVGRTRQVRCQAAEVKTATKVVVKDSGSYSVKGTVRKINEDRSEVQVFPNAPAGDPKLWAGVYDGHGGYAVAEWLTTKLFPCVTTSWEEGKTNPYLSRHEDRMREAYLQADRRLLSKSQGFMGMGERGVGGSKCGATAANVLIFEDKDGSTKLLTSNIGDARIVLIRDGKPVQLSVDHVPDSEDERIRIERYNPNPKMPLVRYVAGTWRVGGLLALSRAFGDAYMKGSLQFEGRTEGSDGYSSGFGVIAEPYCTLNTLTDADQWIVVSSDGLYAEEERGGGGGLDNELLAKMLASAGSTPLDTLAKQLADKAVSLGSTDDVTVQVLRLSPQ